MRVQATKPLAFAGSFSKAARRGAALVHVLAIAAMVFLPAAASPAATHTQHIARHAYREAMQGLAVSFLARDLSTGVEYVLEGSDLDTRHVPFSTFKIPNLVLALETGVAPSLQARREWDPRRRPAASHWPPAWRQGQDLGTAFSRSTVWYFQDLAVEIGTATYRSALAQWHYGNANVPHDADDFWLTGALRLSVGEHVRFLAAMLTGGLGISPSTLAALDQASASGFVDAAFLHGKTGAGPDDANNMAGPFSGWYAGYLRRPGRLPVVFALHVAGPSFAAIRDFRKTFAVRLLKDSGLTKP